MRIIAIIPARGGSKRLANKNIFPLKGKPLLAYTIEACRQSAHISNIYVSTDADEIAQVAKQYEAVALMRPAKLADDTTPKIVAIRQAVNDPAVEALHKDDIVVVAQANSPQITSAQLDSAIEMMLKHNLWEVMSTDANGVQNAAFRVVRYHALFNTFLSAHCGFVVAPNVDVHTLEDVEKIEALM
ncbi:MAG: cytidylyltransferase domain-containing protein [Flavobacteriales bacterium]